MIAIKLRPDDLRLDIGTPEAYWKAQKLSYHYFSREKTIPARSSLRCPRLEVSKCSLALANICEQTPGADIETIVHAIGLDKRIGLLFLRAGLGYGGSCFPKDLKALITNSIQQGYQPHLLEVVQHVNELQPFRAIALAKNLIGSLKDKRIALLGLAFKPNTDDIREAVSLKIIHKLLEEGASVVAHDPRAVQNAKRILGDTITYAKTPLNCLADADCCIIVTEWDLYRRLKPQDFIKSMRNPAVMDGRRIFNPKVFIRRVKFAAIGLGAQSQIDL